jgi:hypothetical protein
MSRFWDMGFPLPGPYPAHPKNKSQKSGIFFRSPKAVINSPAFTTHPPQSHHQKTISIHPISPKPPAKTPIHHAEKNPKKLLRLHENHGHKNKSFHPFARRSGNGWKEEVVGNILKTSCG